MARRECLQVAQPWLPLLCLLMGMRANEACQMAIADVRRTEKGTWYLDVVASDEEDDEVVSGDRKALKTYASRKRIAGTIPLFDLVP